jgi:hypothetical protein
MMIKLPASSKESKYSTNPYQISGAITHQCNTKPWAMDTKMPRLIIYIDPFCDS